MTDPLGQSQVLPYLKGLAKVGYQITIISAEKVERFLKLKSTVENIVNDSKINWQPIHYYSTAPFLSPLLNFFRLRKACLKHASKNEISIVHCRSYLPSLIGLKIKKRYHSKFIFDMRGFFADERLDGGIWNKKNLIKRNLHHYFKRKEIEFLNHSDYTISLTKAAKNEISTWPEVSEKLKIEVIPCCVDLDLFSMNRVEKVDQQNWQQKLKIEPDDYVISYLGSTGTWYLFEEMLDFFKCLQETYSTAKFLIITQDASEDVQSKARKKNIDIHKLIIIGADRVEVPLLLSLSCVSIFFIKPTFSKRASSPTKMGEILAMGIPIITNSGVGDVDQMIIESKCGMLVENFNIKDYKEVIKQIPAFLKRDKMIYSEAAKKYFSLDVGTQKYAKIYASL